MKRSKQGKKEQQLLLILLRELREKAGLTQVQLAKAIRMPQSFVSKYELGERRIDIVETRQIVAGLGLNFIQFAKIFEDRMAAKEP